MRRLSKYLIYIILCIFFVSSVNALNLNLGVQNAWNMNDLANPLIDGADNTNLTSKGISFNQAGILNRSILFNAAGDEVNSTNTIGKPSAFTWTVWVNPNAMGEGSPTDRTIANYNTLTPTASTLPRLVYNVAVNTWRFNTNIVNCDVVVGQVITEGAGWIFLVASNNGSVTTLRVYNTTSLVGNNTCADTINYPNPSHIYIGQRGDDTRNFQGYVDAFTIWNRSLNASEITYVYNTGSGFEYPFGVSNATNFSVSVRSDWDNTVVNNVSINVSGVGVFSNSTGHNIFTNITRTAGVFNITVSSTGWFSKTYLNHNVSGDLSATINQSIISFACFEKVTNNSLTCVNNTIYPNAGTYNFSINVTNYYTRTTINTVVSALDNKTVNVTGFYSGNLSMFSNFITGAGVGTCNYLITGITYPTYSETVSTITTNTSVGLINGTYNVRADCQGYAYGFINVTINSSAQNITFSLFTTNSVNITFFDSQTNTVLSSVNVSIQFIGLSAFNDSTSNGTLYVDLLNPSEYTLVYTSSGYRQGSYVFTLTNKTNTQLSLYLDKDNSTSLVLLTVRDKYSKDPVQNATLTIQRYINNSWVTEQILKTDFNGQAEAWFVVSTEFYNFLVERDGVTYFGVINSNENKKVIYAEDVSDGITIEIDLNPNTVITSYQSTYDTVVTFQFYNTSNLTGYFQMFWDNSENVGVSAEMIVKKGNVVNCTKSSGVESGTLTCNVAINAGDGVTYFTGVGYIDGVAKGFDVGVLGQEQVFKFPWGSTGWLIHVFMIIIGFSLFMASPKISIVVGTLVFGVLILFNVVLAGVGWASISLVFFMGFLIAKIPRKEGE